MADSLEPAGPNRFTGIDHHAILVADVARTRHFYVDILGLAVNPDRPPLSYDGLWLQVGCQSIHCLRLENPDPVDDRPKHGGRDRHVCLKATNVNDLIDRLEQHYIDYTRSQSGRAAIFFRDPDGNAIEVSE
jgi:glyoxylase I family protein